MYPQTNLSPGQTGSEVQKLQQFLLSQGLLTEAQIASGPGIYGPQTTAAVRKWQEKNGVDNSSGPGYWGPKSISVAGQKGGNTNTSTIDERAYKDALSNDKEIRQMTKADPDALANAFATGDWSAVTTPTGTPFSKKMQQDAYKQAEKALAPGFEAEQTYQTAGVEDYLQAQQDQFGNFIKQEGKDFEANKKALDQGAADNGILFSGARYQKENDLRTTFEERQAQQAATTGGDIASTARDYQYQYGNKNAQKLSDMYNLSGGNIYNANTAQNMVKPSMNMTNAYNPNKYKFQGTVLNSNKANTQVRAAGLLANRANKLLGQYQQ